jgi:predicted ABC-type ATPase
MAYSTPLVVVIAGPNGAGKTTASARLLRGALAVNEFVNADTIAQGLSAFRPEEAAIAAGRVMLDRLHTLARERESFAFETTLATRGFAPWLRELREDGYRVHLTFVSLPNAELAVARVQERVRSGGHAVPAGVVRRRYVRGLVNFFTLYRRIVDTWQLLDNSYPDEERWIAFAAGDAEPTIVDRPAWTALVEQTR